MNNQTTANADIRAEIERAGVTYWQVAAKMGIHPCTLSVWLRCELSDELKEKARTAIEEAREEQK